MREYHKSKLLTKLAELLPPFANSLMQLVAYINSDKELSITKELLNSLTTVTREAEQIRLALNNQAKEYARMLENTSRKLTDNEVNHIKEFIEIHQKLMAAHKEVLQGINMLIYLLVEEVVAHNDPEQTGKKMMDEILKSIEGPPSVEEAINNLYYGAKKITEGIDNIIEK
ncbi:hypothetical protein E2L07_05550 [Halalkalibacterium halodurans]|uniref:hypothetical protein n=1 Tax=Halalkalibacterium halodurans TaxID=86665 RepID=UPI0010678F44|nr:hypothetical protein [Halalkalibacterium halodurans]TES56152.1 hypothetical protein E2L07_05550 [Halalkalibacterium halodurans]